jgi:hypothetical protein
VLELFQLFQQDESLVMQAFLPWSFIPFLGSLLYVSILRR